MMAAWSDDEVQKVFDEITALTPAEEAKIRDRAQRMAKYTVDKVQTDRTEFLRLCRTYYLEDCDANAI
jgi:hypothetical protein